MAKRQKRLRKQIEGLERQAERHKVKIETEVGRKDTTHEYWEEEIERFEKRKKEREAMLKKLRRKK
jgi:ppGpp synthetase/RelA/SpoT-type nucleotidyltranferase